MGPSCQVPYNTLLWGEKSPSNMTGVGGSCRRHCCWPTTEPSSLGRQKQRMCNHSRCHSDWLDSNILPIYANTIHTQRHRVRTTGTLTGISTLKESREILAWGFWRNSWLVRWPVPCRIPLISLLSICSRCLYKCMLEFAREPGSSGRLGLGQWVGMHTVHQLLFIPGLRLHDIGPGVYFGNDGDYKGQPYLKAPDAPGIVLSHPNAWSTLILGRRDDYFCPFLDKEIEV